MCYNDNVHVVKILPLDRVPSAISHQSRDEGGNSTVNIKTSFATGKSIEEASEFRPLCLSGYTKHTPSFFFFFSVIDARTNDRIRVDTDISTRNTFSSNRTHPRHP